VSDDPPGRLAPSATSPPIRRVAVIGAGAAGTMAAIFAAASGAETLLLDSGSFADQA